MNPNQQAWKLYSDYVEAWKATTEEQRAEKLAAVVAADLAYFTPEFQGGREAVLADIASFQTKFPGAYFAVEDVSAHHDVALLTWVLMQPDGTALVKGHDQIRISAEGRIASITTFAPSVTKP